MTIEIKPETEALLEEEIRSGHFGSVDELFVEGMNAWHARARTGSAQEHHGILAREGQTLGLRIGEIGSTAVAIYQRP